MRYLAAILLVVSLGGCGLVFDLDDPDEPVAGQDAGAEDAATPRLDAEVRDAGDCTSDDADLDGYSECDGDCDDTDPTRYPDAPLICTGGLSNRCDAGPVDHAMCNGLFVAESGRDSNPGSPDQPFRTLRRALMAATASVGIRRIFMAGGDYPETGVLRLGADVSVRGAFEDVTWRRAPLREETRIEVRVVEGMTILGTATENTILERVTLTQTAPGTHALFIEGGADAIVRDCRIVGGPPSPLTTAILVAGAGIGDGSVPRIEGCEVVLGSGTGMGAFGIRVQMANVAITDTSVELSSDIYRQIGVLLLDTPALARLERVAVGGSTTRADQSIGVEVVGGGARLDALTIDPGTCSGACFGINANNLQDELTITNSRVYAGDDAMQSAALHLDGRLGTAPGTVRIFNNLLVGGDSAAPSHGLYITLDGVDGGRALRIVNNILWGGRGAQSFAVQELPGGPDLDPIELENNALSAESSLALYGNSDARVFGLLALEMQPWANANIESDCGIDPRAGMFDLVAGSECVDWGRSAGAPARDFYGNARPAGAAHDIGPHEL